MIPFNIPHISGRELKAVEQAISDGHFSGDGPFTKKCENWLRAYTGAPHCLLTSSCTHAIEMAGVAPF